MSTADTLQYSPRLMPLTDSCPFKGKKEEKVNLTNQGPRCLYAFERGGVRRPADSLLLLMTC